MVGSSSSDVVGTKIFTPTKAIVACKAEPPDWCVLVNLFLVFIGFDNALS